MISWKAEKWKAWKGVEDIKIITTTEIDYE